MSLQFLVTVSTPPLHIFCHPQRVLIRSRRSRCPSESGTAWNCTGSEVLLLTRSYLHYQARFPLERQRISCQTGNGENSRKSASLLKNNVYLASTTKEINFFYLMSYYINWHLFNKCFIYQGLIKLC